MSHFRLCPACGATSPVDSPACRCGHPFRITYAGSSEAPKVAIETEAEEQFPAPVAANYAAKFLIFGFLGSIVLLIVALPIQANSSRPDYEVDIEWSSGGDHPQGVITNPGSSTIVDLHVATQSEVPELKIGRLSGTFSAQNDAAQSVEHIDLDPGSTCHIMLTHPLTTDFPPDVPFRDQDGIMIRHRDLVAKPVTSK